MGDICAYLFFSQLYENLPQKLAELIRQCQDVDLLQDYMALLARLYEFSANSELNDKLATQLLILLQYTQSIPLEIAAGVSSFDQKHQMAIFMSITSIIASAYSWEDLPDYFEDNLYRMLELLLNLLGQTGLSKNELIIEQNCISVIVNVTINHFNTI